MIFKLKLENGGKITGKYMIKKRFIITKKIEEGEIPKSHVEVKKHESLYIWIPDNKGKSNKNKPSHLKIGELTNPIKKIKIIHQNECWRLKGKKSKKNIPIGNNGNVDEPDVNVEIGEVRS